MIKLVLLIFIFPMISFADCSLQSFRYIYKTDKITNFIKKSDCSREIKKEFNTIIQSANSTLPAKYISQRLKDRFGKKVKISPYNLNINNLNNKLTNDLLIEEPFIITKFNINQKVKLHFDEKPIVNFHCDHCLNTGSKLVNLEINENKYWASVTIKRKVKVAKINLDWGRTKTIINQSDFEFVETLVTSHDNYFKDFNNIQYYRPVRTLHKNTLLKNEHLRKKVLIKRGKKVSINVQKGLINLKMSAIARSTGTLGDVINLINPRSKKIISAKVTGPNMAVIEL